MKMKKGCFSVLFNFFCICPWFQYMETQYKFTQYKKSKIIKVAAGSAQVKELFF